MKTLTLPATAAALLSLCACGGATTSSTGATAVTFDTYAAETQRFDAISRTAFDGVPSSGSANFAGFSSVAVLDTATAEGALLLGSAEISLDFATLGATGTLSGFQGQRDGQTIPYTGTVALVPGSLPGLRPNDVAVSYSGTLSGDGNTLVLSQTDIAAKLLKTPVDGLATVERVGSDPFHQWNGASHRTFVSFWTERE